MGEQLLDRVQARADHQRPNMDALEDMEVKKGSHGPRYCKTCEVYKPPRGKPHALRWEYGWR